MALTEPVIWSGAPERLSDLVRCTAILPSAVSLGSSGETKRKESTDDQGHKACGSDSNELRLQPRDGFENLHLTRSHGHTPWCDPQGRIGHDVPRRLIEARRIDVMRDPPDDWRAILCDGVIEVWMIPPLEYVAWARRYQDQTSLVHEIRMTCCSQDSRRFDEVRHERLREVKETDKSSLS